jgi:hypothetical protein
MWDMVTPTSDGSLRDVGDRVLGSPCAHHLKCRHQNVTNPISIAQKVNTEICIKVNSSMYKAKMELFPKDFVLELNTKNMSNSPSFLTITHTTLSVLGMWAKGHGDSKTEARPQS